MTRTDPQALDPGRLAGFDGVIYCRVGRAPPVANLLAAGIPLIDISNVEDTPGVIQVTSDDRLAGRLAAEHLLALGFQHAAWAGLAAAAYSRKRREGFVARMREAGIEPAIRDLYVGRHEDGRWRSQQELTRAWLAGLPRPCGVLVCSDFDALHLASQARAAGLAIPDDLALIGVDDDDLACVLMSPPLTSVALDGEAVGRLAAEQLDLLLDGRGRPGQLIVPPLGVRPRASTGTEPVADPVVRQAVAWLREHSHEPVRLADCAAACGLAERTLRDRCVRATGLAPHALLQRLRLAHAERLLRGTDLPLKAIARRCGFATAAYLCTAFSAARGVAPGAWRKRQCA